jgi:hypothetical protein
MNILQPLKAEREKVARQLNRLDMAIRVLTGLNANTRRVAADNPAEESVPEVWPTLEPHRKLVGVKQGGSRRLFQSPQLASVRFQLPPAARSPPRNGQDGQGYDSRRKVPSS